MRSSRQAAVGSCAQLPVPVAAERRYRSAGTRPTSPCRTSAAGWAFANVSQASASISAPATILQPAASRPIDKPPAPARRSRTRTFVMRQIPPWPTLAGMLTSTSTQPHAVIDHSQILGGWPASFGFAVCGGSIAGQGPSSAASGPGSGRAGHSPDSSHWHGAAVPGHHARGPRVLAVPGKEAPIMTITATGAQSLETGLVPTFPFSMVDSGQRGRHETGLPVRLNDINPGFHGVRAGSRHAGHDSGRSS
jgi:hypothetical protein